MTIGRLMGKFEHTFVKLKPSSTKLKTKIEEINIKERIKGVKQSAKELRKLNGRAKLIIVPYIFKGVDALGSLARNIAQLAAEAVRHGASSTAPFALAGMVMGSFSIGVQVLMIGVDSFGLKSIRKQHRKFKEAENKGEHLDSVKKSKSLKRLFSPISKNQTERIKKIFSHCAEHVKTEVIEKIDHRFTQMKKMKALAIAIGVIMVVGLALVAFSPTPLAPLAWGVFGTALVLTVAHMLAGWKMSYNFSKFTKAQVIALENEEKAALNMVNFVEDNQEIS